jgi:hypothetical protein
MESMRNEFSRKYLKWKLRYSGKGTSFSKEIALN